MQGQPLRCAACGDTVMMFDPPIDVEIDIFGRHYVEANTALGLVVVGCRARAREIGMIDD